ncbi:hypothetical protein EZV62_003878 [Acer yangbiense]|uniref:Uncharacterized protein n=1 Tax=Acer yangbiense TaxID=1000413 RepID=A0A5C7II75_9ROSI|nr:hypothetical protein EZV62_003878 [Acer yangbiense]
MHELRFLNFYNSSLGNANSSLGQANKVHVSEALEFDFTELRYLSWHGCPIKSLLSSFLLPENLVKLDMSYIKVKQLWNGVHHNHLSDLSGFPNLERLDLQKTAIEELPSSIKYLRRIVNLDLFRCERLKSLPNSVCEWKSLKSLRLAECSMLEELPSDVGTLESLKYLTGWRTAIKELPSSIVDLKNIENLSLNRPGVKGDTAVCWFLPRIVGWQNLDRLDLSYGGITNLPNNLDCLSSLSVLDLKENSFESIPTSIINLSNLQTLFIDNCKKLKYLLPLQLIVITAFNCTSLEVLRCLSIFQNIIDSRDSIFADFCNCCKLDPNISEDIVKDALGYDELPPDWFDYNYVDFVLSVVVAPGLDHQDGSEEYWNIDWVCNLKSKDGDPCVKSGTFLIEVNGSSRIDEDEDVLSLANTHDNCEEEDELIKESYGGVIKELGDCWSRAGELIAQISKLVERWLVYIEDRDNKAKAILEGLTMAVELGCFSLCVESDTLGVMDLYLLVSKKEMTSNGIGVVVSGMVSNLFTKLKGGFRAEDFFFGAGTITIRHKQGSIITY